MGVFNQNFIKLQINEATMNETVGKDALKTIDRVIEILMVKEEKDAAEIKNLSNQKSPHKSLLSLALKNK